MQKPDELTGRDVVLEDGVHFQDREHIPVSFYYRSVVADEPLGNYVLAGLSFYKLHYPSFDVGRCTSKSLKSKKNKQL